MTLKQKVNMLVQMADLEALKMQGMTLDDLKEIEKEIDDELDNNFDYTISCADFDTVDTSAADVEYWDTAFTNELIENLKQQQAVMSILERICKDNTNYINSHFADNTKVYIDGCCEASGEERALFKAWLDKIGGKDFD